MVPKRTGLALTAPLGSTAAGKTARVMTAGPYVVSCTHFRRPVGDWLRRKSTDALHGQSRRACMPLADRRDFTIALYTVQKSGLSFVTGYSKPGKPCDELPLPLVSCAHRGK